MFLTSHIFFTSHIFLTSHIYLTSPVFRTSVYVGELRPLFYFYKSLVTLGGGGGGEKFNLSHNQPPFLVPLPAADNVCPREIVFRPEAGS